MRPAKSSSGPSAAAILSGRGLAVLSQRVRARQHARLTKNLAREPKRAVILKLLFPQGALNLMTADKKEKKALRNTEEGHSYRGVVDDIEEELLL